VSGGTGQLKDNIGSSKVKVYVDKEFTSLDFGLVFDMKLISAGFVAEDGQEFYFELIDNYQRSDCSDFVLEAVLPHLNSARHGLPSAQAAFKLKTWLEVFDETVYMASDAPNYDWPLIKDFLLENKCWPENLDGKPLSVGGYLTHERIEKYFEYQPLAIRHHALWDARALAAAMKGPIND
jgi:hypothetical protein